MLRYGGAYVDIEWCIAIIYIACTCTILCLLLDDMILETGVALLEEESEDIHIDSIALPIPVPSTSTNHHPTSQTPSRK